MGEWTQIGIFAVNVGIAFGCGVLWQRVNGHDESLKQGRERFQSMDKKLDRLLTDVSELKARS